MLKIGILASGQLGLSTLQQITADHAVRFVLTDRGSSDIIQFCDEHSLPVFAGNPRNGRGLNFVQGLAVDVIASINYLFLIEQDLIDFPNQLAFNLHGSLLPKYRGRTPHVWAIINDEEQVGITAHCITTECDAGEIIRQIVVPIEPDDTGASVLKKYEQHYYPIVLDVLQQVETSLLTSHAQDESQATWFGKRTPQDGQIDWNWSRRRIRNWVRAQADPYPGAYTWCDDQKIVIDKVSFSDVGFHARMPNGTVLCGGPLPVVKTPDGAMAIDSIRDFDAVFSRDMVLGKMEHPEVSLLPARISA